MALAGSMRLLLVSALLSTLAGIITLTLYFLPYSFTPTALDSQRPTQSHPIAEHRANLPAQQTIQFTPPIYMISLPRRADRRDKMRKLQMVTELSWTFVDATDSTTPVVGRIMERVRWTRAAVYLRALDSDFLGWWSDNRNEQQRPDPQGSAILWELPSSDSASADYHHPLPTPPFLDERIALEVATGRVVPPLDKMYTPDIPGIASEWESSRLQAPGRIVARNVPPRLVELPHWRILTRSTIACWYSHIGLIRTLATTHLDTGAIILEDDIDMELDIRERISRIWEELPSDWDMLFLGHCWSAEATYPAVASHSQIHRSHSPRCTHAYALSRQGARRILKLLNDPQVAYSRPLDSAILELIRSSEINAYSVFPSVIIQTKDTPSDIFPGNGSSWRDVLQHSALAVVDKR